MSTADGQVRTTTLTFEGVEHRTTIRPEDGYLYPCTLVRFNANWVGLTSGPYSNNPSGVAVATWLAGVGEFTLDAPVSSISLHYASFAAAVQLEAYAGATLVAASDAPPTGGFGVWSVASAGGNAITRVRVVAQARSVLIDDLSYTVVLAIEVPMDVMPGNGDEVDPINLGANGNLPVAVLTTDWIDARTILESSVRLGDATLAGTAQPWRSSVEDVNGDGRPDRVFHFRTQDLMDAGAVAESTTELLLTGRTDATPIFGSDRVRVVPGL